jgi:hypothetical protein
LLQNIDGNPADVFVDPQIEGTELCQPGQTADTIDAKAMTTDS